MKNHYKIYTSIFLAASITAGAVSAVTFTDFKSAPVVNLHIPAKPDSTQNENPYNLDNLLDARDISPYAAAGWTTLVPGPDGKLHLADAPANPALHTLSTKLRANKYAEGKLVLHSNTRAAVKVNGETKITKSEPDSALKAAETTLKLNPQSDYEIIVNILSLPEDATHPEFSLEFIPDKKFENVSFETSASQKGRVSQATAIDGERVKRAALSSNGKYIILLTSETMPKGEPIRKCSLIETATGRVIADRIDYKATWIPGESAFTTTSKRNDKYEIYKTEVPSMQTTLLARGMDSEDFSVTPDGRYLLYYKTVEPKKQDGPMLRIKNPDDRIADESVRNYIMRRDLKTGVTQPVTYGGPTTSIMSITHDGSKLLYGATRQTPDHFPFYSTTLVEVDMTTLACDTIIRDFEQTLTQAIYSPDGRKLFITAGPDAFGKIGANYGSHPIGNDFDVQGYIYDIESKQARAMTRDFDPAIGQAAWNYADGKIYFLGEAGFFQYIYRMDPENGKISQLESDLPYVSWFGLSSDSKEWLTYIGGSFTADGEAYLLNRKTDKSRLISAPLRTLTDNIEFGEMQPWDFTASDGSLIEGWLCLPPSFDSTKKYPLIVYYYGGTSPSNATFYHNYSPQVLASRDYVVYVLNPSGTTGYGQEFSARHVNAWGKQTAEDIIEGTKKFCAAHPFVDSRKIGCIGASYGGFMTQYLLTRTDIFAAAVSHAGISNVTSYWGEGYWGYSYNAVAAAKSYPWNNPELFTQQGSLFNADKIHTPLLLLHGSEDTNVPIGESIQLFNALKILGRDVEFISVTGENHVIRGYENRLIWQNTIMAWFAKYLQDSPEWWNSLYQ